VADFSVIRAGLAANLRAISGLQVEETAPETITPPTVVITPGDGQFIDYDTTMDGCDDVAFTLHLYVPRRLDQVGQAEVDSFLDRTGTKSIYAAVHASPIADTSFVTVSAAFDYGDYTYAGEPYLGCKFSVEIGA
jgi:hypothetical protein